MVINGVDIEQEFGVKLIDVEGNLLPDFRPETVEIPRVGIKYVGRNQILSLTKTLTFVILGNSKDDLLERRKAFFLFLAPFDSEKEIRFDNETGVRYGVISANSLREKKFGGNNLYNIFSLDFTFFDPYQYSTRTKEIQIRAYAGIHYTLENNSFETPFIVEITTLSGTQASNIVLHINDDVIMYSGTLESDPNYYFDILFGKIPVEEYLEMPDEAIAYFRDTLVDEVSGITPVGFDAEPSLHDVLVIDTINFKIEKNGENVIRYMDGEFMNLKAGENIIYVDEDFGNGLYLNFFVRERWF